MKTRLLLLVAIAIISVQSKSAQAETVLGFNSRTDSRVADEGTKDERIINRMVSEIDRAHNKQWRNLVEVSFLERTRDESKGLVVAETNQAFNLELVRILELVYVYNQVALQAGNPRQASIQNVILQKVAREFSKIFEQINKDSNFLIFDTNKSAGIALKNFARTLTEFSNFYLIKDEDFRSEINTKLNHTLLKLQKRFFPTVEMENIDLRDTQKAIVNLERALKPNGYIANLWEKLQKKSEKIEAPGTCEMLF